MWAYERGNFVTVCVLFIAAAVCGVIRIENSLLAAISLSLFYPVFAVIRMLLGIHAGNLLPFEFIGYAFFGIVCLAGFSVGRLIKRFKHKIG